MKRFMFILTIILLVFSSLAFIPTEQLNQEINANPPKDTVKLIFIHHSTGENWLNDENGGLARALQQNNYFPSDTNYGWGPDSIGDRTDIPNWTEWFRSPNTPQIMQAVFTENDLHSPFERTLADPGGENQIILFKSCFPYSALEGNPDDPPTPGSDLNVGNAKYIYNEILQYFKTRPDKLFVLITAPPLIDSTHAANARALTGWLVNDWLKENNYTLPNVAVFDFYNVLTGPNNHHRFVNGIIEHAVNDKRNTEYYPSEDDHPSRQGNQKATAEFLPMLNIFYNRWKSAGAAQPVEPSTAETPAMIPDDGQNNQSSGSPAGAVEGMLFDFESDQPPWEASVDEATGTTALDCQASPAAAFSGKQGLQIAFNVPASSWATCSSFYDSPHDLSKSDGVQFMLKVDEPGVVLHLDVFTGPNGDRATYAREIPLQDAGKWLTVQTLWSNLKRVDWETGGGSVFNHPGGITGFAFGFPAGEKGNSGVIYVDDFQTFNAKSSPSEPQSSKPTVQPAEPSPTPMQSRGFLPFCGSIVFIPLGILVILGRRRG